MKINIVNLDKDKWILTKFANRLKLELLKLGHKVQVSKKPKSDVDVNHYIIFLFLKDKPSFFPIKTVNTVMLTHVNSEFRYQKVREISKYMDAGISMSNHHAKFIKNKKLGLKNVFYVHPAHDNDLKLKKIHFGIFSNLYNDGRKNEILFEKSILKLDPQLFKISIIGKGWKSIVNNLRFKKIEVNYQNFFFRWRYLKELKKIDYLIYLGSDEGSMSFLDAIQVGIKTIMIPQGFQYDFKECITFKINNQLTNLDDVFDSILSEKKKYLAKIEKLSWSQYALNHVKIWNKLNK